MRDSCWERYTWPLSRAHVTWERMKRYTALTIWDRAENGRLRRNVGLGHRRASSQCWLHGCDRSVSLESEISSADSQPRFIQSPWVPDARHLRHQFPSTDGPFRNNRGRRRMSRMSVFLLPSFNMFNRWRFKKDLLTGGWRERGVGRRLEIEAPREEHSERLRRGVSNYGTF